MGVFQISRLAQSLPAHRADHVRRVEQRCANFVIGAPITEESKDEASTCFERQGTTNCSQQHKINETPAQEQADGDA